MTTVEKKRRGRPAKANRTSVPSFTSDLYLYLQEKLSSHCRGGRLHVPTLANTMGMSTQAVYRNLSESRLSKVGAVKIVNASGGKLSLKDLHPFVFKL